jgi:hypothetical protein
VLERNWAQRPCPSPPRGPRTGRAHIGDPQEPGRPRGFSPKGGYHRPRKGRSTRTSHGESECRSTTEEAGEPTRGTLRRKGRHRCMEPLGRTMNRTSSLEFISPHAQRIARPANHGRCNAGMFCRRVREGGVPLTSRSEPVHRRAGCGSPARPDPWGPGRAAGVSRSPGLPDADEHRRCAECHSATLLALGARS